MQIQYVLRDDRCNTPSLPYSMEKKNARNLSRKKTVFETIPAITADLLCLPLAISVSDESRMWKVSSARIVPSVKASAQNRLSTTATVKPCVRVNKKCEKSPTIASLFFFFFYNLVNVQIRASTLSYFNTYPYTPRRVFYFIFNARASSTRSHTSDRLATQQMRIFTIPTEI